MHRGAEAPDTLEIHNDQESHGYVAEACEEGCKDRELQDTALQFGEVKDRKGDPLLGTSGKGPGRLSPQSRVLYLMGLGLNR